MSKRFIIFACCFADACILLIALSWNITGAYSILFLPPSQYRRVDAETYLVAMHAAIFDVNVLGLSWNTRFLHGLEARCRTSGLMIYVSGVLTLALNVPVFFYWLLGPPRFAISLTLLVASVFSSLCWWGLVASSQIAGDSSDQSAYVGSQLCEATSKDDWRDWMSSPFQVDHACLPTGASCCVCLEDYAAGDVVISLECRHVLHKTCAEAWVVSLHSLTGDLRSRLCPMRCDNQGP
eukprot:TRINITY_DN76033_c0_g1_i1.p1 TRINITY_DN76033_c0_g1~~TRINITY_DN76033_c0_g1_i1.p1  ORF type:complete len:259 (-),score=17.48 TRINITY_DN76033_c0_g1_i1:269-979(-)